MKTYIVNTQIQKGKKNERRNFDIKSASQNEADLKNLIWEKLEIDTKKWELESETYKLIERECVIIYNPIYKEIETES